MEKVDGMLAALGYEPLGGVTNLVYLHRAKGEVLKLSPALDADAAREKTEDFLRCMQVSEEYAPRGLMPRVYEAGADFMGTGLPYLREEYIPGQSLTRAFLADRAYWQGRLPAALEETYAAIQAGPAEDVAATWREKLDGMVCPDNHRHYYSAIRRSGELLAERYPTGCRIHGDLQFGNLLCRQDRPGSLLLIDWEMSEVMPLGYEFAMLYTFMMGPSGQIEPELDADYDRISPLKDAWRPVAAMMRDRLGICPEEFTHSVLFRMGNAWLWQLDRAVAAGDRERIADRERALTQLLGGGFFAALPYE